MPAWSHNANIINTVQKYVENTLLEIRPCTPLLKTILEDSAITNEETYKVIANACTLICEV